MHLPRSERPGEPLSSSAPQPLARLLNAASNAVLDKRPDESQDPQSLMSDPVNPKDTPAPTGSGRPDSSATKIAIGVAAGIVALAIAIIFASNGADSADSCTLSVAAVGAIAVASNHGESANAVLESAAFAPVCSLSLIHI